MKAVILAGYSGERMKPFSRMKPKQLMPVLNRTVLDRLLEKLYSAGALDVAIVVSETDEQIRKHLGDAIRYYPNIGPHGTASGVASARGFIDSDEPFYVVAGDVYCEDNLKHLLDLNPLVVSGFPVKNASKYGTLDIDQRGRLIRIKEKEGVNKPALINASIYLFDRRVFDYIDRTPVNPKRGELELTDSINYMIGDGNDFMVYELRGRWRDIGYPRDLVAANIYAAVKLFGF